MRGGHRGRRYRFAQRGVFTGLLVPLARRVLDGTAIGFAEMNAALRDRAIARAAGPVQPMTAGPDGRYGPPPAEDTRMTTDPVGSSGA